MAASRPSPTYAGTRTGRLEKARSLTDVSRARGTATNTCPIPGHLRRRSRRKSPRSERWWSEIRCLYIRRPYLPAREWSLRWSTMKYESEFYVGYLPMPGGLRKAMRRVVVAVGVLLAAVAGILVAGQHPFAASAFEFQ